MKKITPDGAAHLRVTLRRELVRELMTNELAQVVSGIALVALGDSTECADLDFMKGGS